MIIEILNLIYVYFFVNQNQLFRKNCKIHKKIKINFEIKMKYK